MANSNALTSKTKLPGPSSTLKITPGNSPVLKPASRLPNRHSPYQTSLSLQTVIGTTTLDPNGFSCHEPTNTFAFCAGSSAVLVELEEDLKLSQRFFRAHPSANSLNSVSSFFNHGTPAPSTPDSRTRPSQSAARQSTNGTLFPSSPNLDWGDTNQSRTWSSRERIKAVTAVSLSPNGRFLAVGETGYNPRVLIFSTAKDAPAEYPLSIMTDHSFGVRGLAFSPNSQYLTSLGDMNDGFLFVWSINLRSGAARLHSTNKCTSFVRDMCWMGRCIITVGTRHIKVWRLPDSAAGSTPIALPGRNCLLGSLVDSNFTCITSISEKEAIICTDTGAVCILDDSGGQQKLHLVRTFDFGICSVAVDFETSVVWFAGRGRSFKKCSIEELRDPVGRVTPSSPSPMRQAPRSKAPAVISMGVISSQMVTVDSTRAIRVCCLDKLQHCQIEGEADVSIPAHKSAVLGLGTLSVPNAYSSDFFTWSSVGEVGFWNLSGSRQATMNVELEQLTKHDDETNELKILRAMEGLGMFVSGDKYGVLRIITGQSWQCLHEVRAHGGEITDITVRPNVGHCLVASCGRDRMVQLFRYTNDRFELIQTMDEHVGAVGRLLFANDGERLLSCSADRTVVIRDRMIREADDERTAAFILSKVITLKASPVSMTIPSDDPDGLVISTIDRQIHKFNIPSARNIHSFRASDAETSDTVVMSSLTVESGAAGQSPRLLVGVSTTDKSIRVYDLERDVLLAREFGHTEGISDVILLQTSETQKGALRKTLISSGLDGVITIWNLSVEPVQSPQEKTQTTAQVDDDTPTKELTATKPPLRRILSRTELSVFQKLDAPSPSPAPIRELSPPRIRKRTSRISMGPQFMRNGNDGSPTTVPTPSIPPPSRRSPTSPIHLDVKSRRSRSPSPPSPKASAIPKALAARTSRVNLRRQSLDPRPRPPPKGSPTSSTSGSEFGSLSMSTEQVCRALRAYRKKLQTSAEPLNSVTELERELDLTSRALSERTAKRLQAKEELSIRPMPSKDRWIAKPATAPKAVARRIPSTPNLGQARKERFHRANSVDSAG